MTVDWFSPRALPEGLIYCLSIAAFAISALFLGLDALLSALVVFSFIIGFFFRGWPVPIAALAAFAAAVVVSPPSLSLGNVIVFGLFALLPFLFCFRTASARNGGYMPVEPFGALIPVLACAFAFIMNTGFFFSSTESISPHGLAATSFIVLLSVSLAVPLLAEAWGRLAGPVPPAPPEALK
jgi:hypothetical protein